MQVRKKSPWVLIKAVGLLIIPLCLSFVASANEKEPGTSGNQQQCRKFVQNFYAWYVNTATNDSKKKSSSIEQAVHDKAGCFSATLLTQLKEDIDASSKNPGEIVGLDFDPVLNSQEITAPYKVEKVTVGKNDHYLVDVYGTVNGKRSSKPDVTPELVFSGGNWRFVNFHYEREQPPTDLLSVLKELREDRKMTETKKHK